MTRFDLSHTDYIDLEEFINIAHNEDIYETSILLSRPFYSITDDDLLYDGSLTVSILRSTDVSLKGFGNITPYVKVSIQPFEGHIYTGETRPAQNCKCINNSYLIKWSTNEGRDIKIRYPGIENKSDIRIEFSLYDTDRFKDILIGRGQISNSSLYDALKTGKESNIELTSPSGRTGNISAIFYLIPERIEQENLISKQLSKEVLTQNGSLYLTIHKVKGINIPQVKVTCSLLPSNEIKTTLSASSENNQKVINFSRIHNNILKFKISGETKMDYELKIELSQERKILSNIILGKKILPQNLIEQYILTSGLFWIPILDTSDNIICRIQLSLQFVLLTDDQNVLPIDWNIAEIDKASSLPLSRLKDLISLSIPIYSSPDILKRMKECDYDGSNKIPCNKLCGILSEFKVELNNEIKATILKEFDPHNTGYIDYVLFCAIALPNEYLTPILEGIKDKIIESRKQGKDFHKAFEGLGFTKGVGITKEAFM